MAVQGPNIDIEGIFQTLTLLVRSSSPAVAKLAPRILACFDYNTDPTVARKRLLDDPTGKRTAEATDEHRATEEINKTPELEWQCEDCDSIFRSKSSLDIHINDYHTVKRRRLLRNSAIFECSQCDATFSTETALRNHQNKYATRSDATPKLKSYKCHFCDKENADSYINEHYENEHQTKNPKQMLWYNGDKLVSSTIDTKGGKAPWFKREKETVTKRYKNVTCRLCEDEKRFDYKEMLQVHYTLFHKVDPGLVNTLNLLFRAAKRSNHLSASNPRDGIDLTTISDRAPRESLTNNKNNTWSCYWCDKLMSTKGNLKKHILMFHMDKPSNKPRKRAFACDSCDKVFNAEAVLNRHKNKKHTSTTGKSTAKTKECIVKSSSDNKTKTKCNAVDSSAEHNSQKLVGTENNGMFVYQCEECEVVTSSYDASVEHAQLHYLKNYKPITETCQNCKFTFEPFACHSCDHPQIDRTILKYNPSNLLSDDWFDIFQGLPDTVTDKITSSSVYKYTRALKINSDKVTGIPLYHCGMCDLYVHPKDVEEHCNNKEVCVRNKSQNYRCSICDIFFYSSGAITNHFEKHKSRREISSFRKVTFNCEQDATINRALQEFQKSPRQTFPLKDNIPHPADKNALGIQQGSRKSIENVDEGVASVFCNNCDKFILWSEFATHAKTHKSNQNVPFQEDYDLLVEENEEENCLNSRDKEYSNTANIASQNKQAGAVEYNNERTIEDMYCECCKKLVKYSDFETHADAHNIHQNGPFQENYDLIEKENDEENCLISRDKECRNTSNIISQNKEVGAVGYNDEGTIEDGYCEYCNQFIMYSEFETHAKSHKSNQNVPFQEDYDLLVEENEEENSLNSRDKEYSNTANIASQNKEFGAVEYNNEGTIEDMYCECCKKFVKYSDFETHADAHNIHQNVQFQEDNDLIQKENDEENCVNSRDEESKNATNSQNNEDGAVENDDKGSIEQWYSDDDSCSSLEWSNYEVRAEVHINPETN